MDQSVNGGGGGKPSGHNQNRCFYGKEKRMQSVLKWKNMQKYF